MMKYEPEMTISKWSCFSFETLNVKNPHKPEKVSINIYIHI
jgi:hypothetical protein